MLDALGRAPPPPSDLRLRVTPANAVNKYTGLNLSGEEAEEYEDEEEMKTPPRSSPANTNVRAAFAPTYTRKEQGGSRRRGRKSTRRGRKSTRRSRKSTRRGRKSTRGNRRS